MNKIKYRIKNFLKFCLQSASKFKFFLCHKFYKNLQNYDYESSRDYILQQFTPLSKTTNYNEPFKYDVSLSLSIIVPVYNVKRYLSNCIESLIQKTDYSYEIILIDDGSTDGSSEFCDEYAKKYNFIKVMHQENQGISSSRNKGIINSRGKYILFVDSDDYLLPNSLSNVDLTKLNHNIIQFRHSFSKNNKTLLNSHKFLKSNPKILNLYYGYMWNKFYKREIFTNIKNPVGFWFEDMINDLIIFPSFKNIMTSNQITYSYRLNEKGITSTSRFSNRILDSFFVLKEITDHIDDYKIKYTNEHLKRLLYQASSQIYARIRKQNKNILKHCFILLCQLVNSIIKKYKLDVSTLNKCDQYLVLAFKAHNFSAWKNISQFYK